MKLFIAGRKPPGVGCKSKAIAGFEETDLEDSVCRWGQARRLAALASPQPHGLEAGAVLAADDRLARLRVIRERE